MRGDAPLQGGCRVCGKIYVICTYIPTIPTLEKIARVLGVSTGDLLEDVPDDTSTT
jgi:hypothetical protein